MTLHEAILTHPWQFAVSILLLLVGPWLLRKAACLLLLGLAIGVAAAINVYLLELDVIPITLLSEFAIHGLFISIAILAMRHPIVARDAEALLVLAICLLVGQWLASTMLWPASLVWAMLIIGTILTPVIPVALFSAALFAETFELSNIGAISVVFMLCLAFTFIRAGGWRRGHFDHSLYAEAKGAGAKRAICGRSVRSERTPVVFRCFTKAGQRRLVQSLESRGISCTEFLAGYTGAEVPGWLLRQWRWPWNGLFRIQPDWVANGRQEIVHPPIHVGGIEQGVTLAEVAERMRSYTGSSLPTGVATGKNTVVAILDTGCNGVTPGLSSAMLQRVSFVAGEREDDQRGHGTAVAACVNAVAPKARLVSVKVLDRTGSGTLFSILRGLKYVAEHRDEIHCANLSLGARLCGGRNGDPLCRGLVQLAKLGVATVTAIGNSGRDGAGSVECPGASPGTIGVAAVDLAGQAAPWSSRGPCADSTIHKPDVACFGVNLSVPNHLGELTVLSGTSFSAPLVAGAMAACIELTSWQRDARRLYDLIRNTCIPPESCSTAPEITGHGLVNLKRAADAVRGTANGEQLARAPASLTYCRQPIYGTLLLPAAAVALVLLAMGTWWFGFGHIGFPHPDGGNNATWMLGRVGAIEQNRFVFDDGTGTTHLHWAGPSGTEPSPGWVIAVYVVHTDHPDVVHGKLRIRLPL